MQRLGKSPTERSRIQIVAPLIKGVRMAIKEYFECISPVSEPPALRCPRII
jgi:hypothetical protein